MSEINRYEALCQYIKSLGKDVRDELDQLERIAFSSNSKNKIRRKKQGLRLAWLLRNYNPNSFRVWVRREMRGTPYPDTIKTISDYTPFGGWEKDYPAFNICSDEDLEKAKQIIKFAYMKTYNYKQTDMYIRQAIYIRFRCRDRFHQMET